MSCYACCSRHQRVHGESWISPYLKYLEIPKPLMLQEACWNACLIKQVDSRQFVSLASILETLTLDALEDLALQPVGAHLLDALDLVVSADSREDLSPDDPVHKADTEDSPSGNGQGLVGHGLVQLASGRRRSQGDDEEEDVGSANERKRDYRRLAGLAPIAVWLEL